MNFKETLAEKTVHAEDVLTKYLPEEKGYQKKVIESMNYSALAGGKRLRPILMEESFRLFGGNSAIVEPFMAALEMIHNYSLVHDDLPAMDNDEYRRGRKTTWNVYGEGMAVLAGDALLNKAFETAAEAFSMIGEAADIAARYAAVAKALQILANKAGIYGMIGGQCADICAEELPADQVTKELLWYIHKNKTAALIEAALMIGAVLAGASDEEVKKAYRDLARKYHPDNYHDNPLADLAQEKMKEINEAYEQIQKQRRAASGYGAPRQSYYGTTSNGYSSADPTMQQIRLAIARGDISQAERLLNAVSDHNAEWSFLMGNVCYRRGWLDEAKRYFETACRMDPENPEYRQALAAFNNRGYRPQGYQTVSTSCGNDVCSNWCLAALCCNLLGGGGYFCLPCMF